MKNKKYKRLLEEAGRCAILADYYGEMLDSEKDQTNRLIYQALWQFYNDAFSRIARKHNVLERVFG